MSRRHMLWQIYLLLTQSTHGPQNTEFQQIHDPWEVCETPWEDGQRWWLWLSGNADHPEGPSCAPAIVSNAERRWWLSLVTQEFLPYSLLHMLISYEPTTYGDVRGQEKIVQIQSSLPFQSFLIHHWAETRMLLECAHMKKWKWNQLL